MPSPQRGELAGDVEAWLAEDGVGSAKLSIGERSYTIGRARRDHEQLVIGDRVTRDSASMCAPRLVAVEIAVLTPPIVRGGRRRLPFEQVLRRLGCSPRAGLTLAAGAGAVAIALSIRAARHFADTPWPLSRGHPGLLTAAGLLFLVTYALKIWAWRRLFTADERPQALALAAATGGASIIRLALPGRCTDVVRIAIVHRYPGCPAGVRTLCLSLVMLGVIEIAALASLLP
jgi:hypothetical protein